VGGLEGQMKQPTTRQPGNKGDDTPKHCGVKWNTNNEPVSFLRQIHLALSNIWKILK